MMQGALWGFNKRSCASLYNECRELNSSSWWLAAEHSLPALVEQNQYLALLILFIDIMHLGQKGRLQAEPVILELSNLALEQQMKDALKLMLGMLPTYPKTQEEKKQDRKLKESDTNYMIWYHKCLHVILKK